MAAKQENKAFYMEVGTRVRTVRCDKYYGYVINNGAPRCKGRRENFESLSACHPRYLTVAAPGQKRNSPGVNLPRGSFLVFWVLAGQVKAQIQ